MTTMKNVFDSLEECTRWFQVLEQIGYNGFSMIQFDGKWHCECHKYKM